ncbi:MAG: VOC family protein, partial [Pseudonocardiaceae bacterium]
MATESRFQDVCVDHVRYYVADLDARIAELEQRYGFEIYAESADDEQRSAAIGRDDIRLVLTEALVEDYPAGVYVAQHDDGISDIALSMPDAVADFQEAVRRGARPLAEPVERDGVITATIGGFADVVHTFVQRTGGVDQRHLAGFAPSGGPRRVDDSGLLEVDHFAVCLEADQLEPTVEFYQRVLDFDMTFTEKIVVDDQAMNSKVVQSRSREVTLTLIEPDTSHAPGQIDRFLKNHGGPGVQHVAFRSLNIVRSVRIMLSNGA